MTVLIILDEVTSDTPNNEKLLKCFYCHKCGKFFTTFLQLHLHALRYAEHEHQFRCAICNYTVGSVLIELLQHIEKFHNSDTFKLVEEKMAENEPEVIRYYCASCGKGIRTLHDLLIHDKDHQGDLLCCDVCPKQTATFSMLMTHYKEHTVLGHIHLQCQMCSLKFYHPTPLKLHYYTVHRHMLNIPFECDFCQEVLFDDEERFLFHVQAHTCLNTEIKSNRLRMDVSKSTCEVCGRIFNSIGECKRHKSGAHRLKKNAERTCPICKGTVTLKTISDHLTYHEKRKAYDHSIEFPNKVAPNKNNQLEVLADVVALSQQHVPEPEKPKKDRWRTRQNLRIIVPDKSTRPLPKSKPTQPIPSTPKSKPSTSYEPRPQIRINLEHMKEHVSKKASSSKQQPKLPIESEHMKEHVLEKASSSKQQPKLPNEFGPTQMKCTKCDKSFTFSVVLREHMKEHEKVSHQPKPKIQMNFKSRPTQRKCSKCDKSFFFSAALNEHMKEHILPLQQSTESQVPSLGDMFLEWNSGNDPQEEIVSIDLTSPPRDQHEDNGSYWVDETISRKHIGVEPIADPNSIDYIQHCYGIDTPYFPSYSYP
ncbi:unnamed protein product [Ceutorhynchus assimilis]|uniref:C2H2-type domain-containing protein n=1 Tax=Ceutorhynchus assimilis TaxID=467358 RepID=A0A9N9MHW6_9CUCU|nr:unnamed protein product [Ceutorhynchus assimilis]